jgi:hypothetical protein
MNNKFRMLRVLAVAFKVLAVLVLIIAILSVLGFGLMGMLRGGPGMMGQNFWQQPFQRPYNMMGGGSIFGLLFAFGGLIYGGIIAMILYAFGELISLLLAIEVNTRQERLAAPLAAKTEPPATAP